MPRNGSGTYSLAEAPFVPNTAILSAEVNSDFDDIADALTDSVASDGQTPITGALQGFPGTLALPGYSWSTDPNTGRWHSASDEMQDVVGGVAAATYSATGVDFPVGASVAGTSLVLPTGVVFDFLGAAAPTGFVLAFGTIGDATSGATNRANADTFPLFNLMWFSYSDTLAPVSGGRGASPTADFAAHKTIGGLDFRGYVAAGLDNIGGSAASRLTSTTMTPDGVTLGATGGAQTVTISQANLPAANLNPNTASQTLGHTSSGVQSISPNAGSVGGTFTSPGGAAGFTSDKFTAIADHTVTFPTVALGGSGTATNKVQPTRLVSKIIKL